MPAIAIQREGEVVLFDCGEGAQRRILSEGIGLNKDTTVLITHLHGDHVTGLLGLLQTMSLAQRRKPLRIVGPRKLKDWLKATSEILEIGLTFEVEFFPVRQGVVLRTKGFVIRATHALHSAEAHSYLIEERGRPGVFYPKKAKRLGIPEGKLWSRLQKGRSVLVGGRSVSPREVSGPVRPGRRVGYSGDTRPSSRLSRFFSRCDLLIFDSTFAGRDRQKAVERRHSTCVEAAEVAKKAHARKLALTHFSARYASVTPLLKEARAVFQETVAAADGMKVSVPYPET